MSSHITHLHTWYKQHTRMYMILPIFYKSFFIDARSNLIRTAYGITISIFMHRGEVENSHSHVSIQRYLSHFHLRIAADL